jgi:hypothetical protein
MHPRDDHEYWDPKFDSFITVAEAMFLEAKYNGYTTEDVVNILSRLTDFFVVRLSGPVAQESAYLQ